MTLNTFKEKFEAAAFISVYAGYLLQLIIFIPSYDGLFLIFLGIFAFVMIILFNVMFSYPIIIIHHIIYLSMISSMVGSNNYGLAMTINTIFFLPFYIVIIYLIINLFIFDLDSILEKKMSYKQKK
ncbi:MAG: hypothetical protein RJA76_485 [Bacteroidota bacterium]|jgi:hypothetical protein